ncbi:MAG: hypothetical protein R3A45_13075 [Bdellovibrionota bacterium]
MTATINISSETATGHQSPMLTSMKLTMRSLAVIIIQFSNSDGYAIQFQLLGSSPNPTSYSMSSGNSHFLGLFINSTNGQSVSVNVVSTGLGSLIPFDPD